MAPGDEHEPVRHHVGNQDIPDGMLVVQSTMPGPILLGQLGDDRLVSSSLVAFTISSLKPSGHAAHDFVTLTRSSTRQSMASLFSPAQKLQGLKFVATMVGCRRIWPRAPMSNPSSSLNTAHSDQAENEGYSVSSPGARISYKSQWRSFRKTTFFSLDCWAK